MALLQLKDIGKIYVSEGNVAVGIRGVNLSFDKGEFVAITGQSGSGKSTLLNVISGIDTYEEGELFIEGEPTSHFLQPEWEDYRQTYISFIFQDYNIIESFTVLQNVELALMHIENKKERRRRALELLDRVGMTSHLHHKGSRLSGGQKQRTVIARALAKDSPIILADEPTGNLDSATSAEIIELLREVSRDKLLIMVTHNFEQVEHCATRHIRVYDGAIESDQALRPTEAVAEAHVPEAPAPTAAPKKAKKHYVRKGITLGRSLFTSRPKLSVFLCLLLIIGALGIFLITGYCGSASLLFQEYTMFTPMDGRVVLTRQDGSPISEETLADLASRYGAKDSLRYDSMLDAKNNYAYLSGNTAEWDDFSYDVVYDMTFDAVSSVGRYPQKPGEVYLYLPISKQPIYGETALRQSTICLNNSYHEAEIVGVGYYYDNNLTPKVVFTREGFLQATATDALMSNADLQWNLSVRSEKVNMSNGGSMITVWEELPGDCVYVNFKAMDGNVKLEGTETVSLAFSVLTYGGYGSYGNYGGGNMSGSYAVDPEKILTKVPDGLTAEGFYEIYVSSEFIQNMYTELRADYGQASLFFENDRVAESKLAALQNEGYVAVLSDTEYEASIDETLSNFLLGALMALLWIVAIVFLAFFINLCTNRTLAAFKGDMAIMRSMGIPVGAIRVGMYVRMLIALIPAYIAVIVAGFVVFRFPSLNALFMYLYPWQYALIFAGLLLLTFRITRGQIRRLFRESVKKSLRGGNAE